PIRLSTQSSKQRQCCANASESPVFRQTNSCRRTLLVRSIRRTLFRFRQNNRRRQVTATRSGARGVSPWGEYQETSCSGHVEIGLGGRMHRPSQTMQPTHIYEVRPRKDHRL